MGLRNGLGLLVVAAAVWGIAAPMLVESRVVLEANYDALLKFLLWPGVALMVSAGLAALVMQWRSIARAFSRGGSFGARSGRTGGVVICAMAAIVVAGWQGFGIHPVLAVLMIVGLILAALVCVRSVGEAGVAPISQLGQLAQISHGGLSSTTSALNIAAASIVAGSIVQSAQTMESFRVGQLLNVAPARQIRSAGLGIVLGTLVALPAYLLVTRAYGLGTAELPAPNATTWKAMGDLVEGGRDAVPAGAMLAAGVASLCGVALQALASTSIGRFIPSPFVLGLAFLIPANLSFSIALGSIAGTVLARWLPGGEGEASSLGAGTIAGESIVGVIVAGLTVAHVLPL